MMPVIETSPVFSVAQSVSGEVHSSAVNFLELLDVIFFFLSYFAEIEDYILSSCTLRSCFTF